MNSADTSEKQQATYKPVETSIPRLRNVAYTLILLVASTDAIWSGYKHHSLRILWAPLYLFGLYGCMRDLIRNEDG